MGALFAAGSDTIAVSATTTMYHVLHNLEIQERFGKELHTTWPVLEEVPRYDVFRKATVLSKSLERWLVQPIPVHAHWIANCRRPNVPMRTPFARGLLRPDAFIRDH